MSDRSQKPPARGPGSQPESGNKTVTTRPWGGLKADAKAALDGARRILRAESRAQSGKPANPKIPQGGGNALPNGVRSSMERKLGANLGGVKIHTSGSSASAAGALGARAFTVGSDVHFNSGEFNPESKEGRKLLAHELTHVVQGERSGIQRKADGNEDEAKGGNDGGLEVSDPDEPAEKEADQVADDLAAKEEEEGDGEEAAEGDGAEAAEGAPDEAKSEKKDAKSEKGDAKDDKKAKGDKGDAKDDKKDAAKADEKPAAISAKLDAGASRWPIYAKKKGLADDASDGAAPDEKEPEAKGGEVADHKSEKQGAKADDAKGDKKDDAKPEKKDGEKADAKSEKKDDEKADAKSEKKDDEKADAKGEKKDDEKADAKGEKKADEKSEKKDQDEKDEKDAGVEGDTEKPDDAKAGGKADKKEKADKDDEKADAKKEDGDEKSPAKEDDAAEDAKSKGAEKVAEAAAEDDKGDEKADAKGDEKADAKGDEKADAKGDEKADAKGDAAPDAAAPDAKADAAPDAAAPDAKGDAASGAAAPDASAAPAEAKGDAEPQPVQRKIFRAAAAGAPAARPAGGQTAPAGGQPAPAAPSGPPPPNPTQGRPEAADASAAANRPAPTVERVDTAVRMAEAGPNAQAVKSLPPIDATPGARPQPVNDNAVERTQRAEGHKPQPLPPDEMKAGEDSNEERKTAMQPALQKFRSGQGPEAPLGGEAPAEAKKPVDPRAAQPPPLPVDGILGTVAVGEFIAAANAIGTGWAGYGAGDAAAQKRGDAFMTAVNAQLTGAGEVGPKVNPVYSSQGPSMYGHMDQVAWTLELNIDMFKDDQNKREKEAPAGQPASRDDLARTATGVYHEARHIEQWHKMARMRAGQFEEDVNAIVKATSNNMNRAAISDAHGKPLGTPKVPADPRFLAWFESVYDPTKGADRSNTLKEWKRLLDVYQAAMDAQKAAYTPADDKAKLVKAKATAYDTQAAVVAPLKAANDEKRAAYPAKETAYQTKEQERTTVAAGWREKKAALDALVDPFDQARATRRDKFTALGQKKTSETQLKTNRDGLEAQRVTKEQAYLTAWNTFQQKDQQYAPLYQAWEANKTDAAKTSAAKDFGEKEWAPARAACQTAWTAVQAARTAAQQADEALAAGQRETTAAEAEWKDADAAFTRAIAAFNTANTAFELMKQAWTRVSAEYQTAKTEWEQAKQAWQTAFDAFSPEQTKLEGLQTEYWQLKGEFDALLEVWKQKKAATDAAQAAWKPFDDKYHALPEEVDAYRTEELIGIAYRKRYPAA
jgi:hypothetical protein